MLHASRARIIGAVAATIFVVALVGCGSGGSSAPPGAEATDEGKLRTVLVFAREPATASIPGGTLHAGLEEGRLPSGQAQATVLTDEDCAPDGQGVSHCRNMVRLDDGRTLVLRHPHDMTKVPCLAPGESVLLRGASRPS